MVSARSIMEEGLTLTFLGNYRCKCSHDNMTLRFLVVKYKGVLVVVPFDLE